MSLSTTHTYVILEVSQQTYNEIHTKLRDAGYDHAFMNDGEIDMHGVAVAAVKSTSGPYYYGGVASSTGREPDSWHPYVYHYPNSNDEEEEIQDYLGGPLPSLEEATDAARQWAEERGFRPLELE